MIIVNNGNNASVSPDILGVTISTPGYQGLAIEAAKRFRKFSGCDTVILESDHKNGFNLKLELHRIFANRDICFFDADLWPIREFDLSPYVNSGAVVGVNDPSSISPASFCYWDSISIGIPFSRYLNTGFLICDFKNRRVRNAFEFARNNINLKKQLNIQDKTEQSVLNLGFKKCKVVKIPLKWNFWKKAADWGHVQNIPRDVINVHAAGYELPMKWDILTKHAEVFGEKINDMNNKNTMHKGFIISTKDQFDIAEEARRRALRFANLSCDIIEARDKKHAHYLKLKVLAESTHPCYLLDNDIWFIKQTTLPSLEKDTVYACRCFGNSIEKRCKDHSLKPEIYFNSGLVGIGEGNKIRTCLQEAIVLRELHNAEMDEMFMNIAFQRNNISIKIIPDTHNYCNNEHIRDDVVAIHAARRPNKMDWLMKGVMNYASKV